MRSRARMDTLQGQQPLYLQRLSPPWPMNSCYVSLKVDDCVLTPHVGHFLRIPFICSNTLFFFQNPRLQQEKITSLKKNYALSPPLCDTIISSGAVPFSFSSVSEGPTFTHIKNVVLRIIISVGSARLLLTAFVFEIAFELSELPSDTVVADRNYVLIPKCYLMQPGRNGVNDNPLEISLRVQGYCLSHARKITQALLVFTTPPPQATLEQQ